MKTNVGNFDRAIRLFIPLVIVLLYFFKVVSGTFGTVLLIVAGVLALTSIAGICPLYSLFGINTSNKQQLK